MSNTWKFEHDWGGYQQLMKSAEVKAMLQPYADKQRSNLGAGYSAEPERGRTRWGINVWASSEKAQKENLKHNTLLKSLGGGKL